MNNLEFFKKLEDKYNELVAEAKDYEGRLAFLEEEFPEEADMYNKLTVDDTTDIEVIRQMCPNAYELEVKKRALIESIDKMDIEIEKRAQELKKEIDEKVVTVKTKLAKNEKHLEKTEAEIEKIKAEIEVIKSSEEYKNKDEDAILRLEDLEADLEAKEKRVNVLRADIDEYKSEIEDLENEMKELFGKYLNEEEPVTEEPVTEEPVAEEPVAEEPVTEEPVTEEPVAEEPVQPIKVKPRKVQQQVNPAVNSIVADNKVTEEPAEENNTKLSPELAETVDKAKDLKKQYEEITSKKPEDLTIDDRINLSNILAEKENYDKLGIRTGLIFNDSKKMLKTIATGIIGNRTIKNIDKELVAKSDEKLLSYTKLLSWKGIKEVGEGKLALEQTYENVIEHYKNDLDDPKNKKIYDQAKKGLEEIQALRKAVKTNNEVTLEKRNESKLFSLFNKKQDNKMLEAAPKHEPEVVEAPSLAEVKKDGLDMSGLTNPPSKKDVELAESSKNEVTVEEQTK